MTFFPFMMDIEEKHCLIFGAGEVAFQKLEALLPFRVHIHIYSDVISEKILKLDSSYVNYQIFSFSEDRLYSELDEILRGREDFYFFSVVATDQHSLNHKISQYLKERKILVNTVDQKEDCDFYFPAMIHRAKLLLSVSSSGESPMAVSRIKRKIEEQIPDYYGELISNFSHYRKKVLEEVEDRDRRKQILNALYDRAESRKGKLTDEDYLEIIEQFVLEQHREKRKILIGTRGSALALWQANYFLELLKEKHPEYDYALHIMKTKGDQILDKPLLAFGGKGAFVIEFEEALKQGKIDFAVHSAKDMPEYLETGLSIVASLRRGDVRDVLVLRKGASLSDKLRIGTGSSRRRFQLKKLYPHFECIPIRGNVQTRLDKIRTQVCDGVVLAMAGLERLKLLEESTLDYYPLDVEKMLPAAGQGIIAIEARTEDRISELARDVTDSCAELSLSIEREVLHLLNAGCHDAIAVYADIRGEQIDSRLRIEREGRVLESSLSKPLLASRDIARCLVSGLENQEGENA